MPPTVLIGLDGATWTILDPYMERGVMPFLRDLCARGTRAPLRSIVPALTPPAWTSVMTGKRPGGHGVFDFFQKDDPDSIHFRFASSQDVHSATIWSLASDAGQRIISLNFPLMFPAPDVAGCVVPGGMMPWRQLRLGCHPAGLFDRLKALPGFNPREMLDMELEVKAIEGCPADEQHAYVEQHITREQRWLEVARHLIREEPAELIGVMFDGVDKLQHLCWRFIDPACRPAEPDALGAGHDRPLRALLPHRRRHPRRARRARRARRDARARLRPRLRADAGRLPRQRLAASSRAISPGRTGTPAKRATARSSASRRSRATSTRSTGRARSPTRPRRAARASTS